MIQINRLLRRQNQPLSYTTYFLFVLLTIGFAINNIYHPNIAHSELLTHQYSNKLSSHPSLSSNVNTGNERIGVSKLIAPHKLSSSNSTMYSTFSTPPPTSTSASHPISAVHSSNKVIMINFDDAWKSQIQYAKPILDKYGFKASFFRVCNYVNSGNPSFELVRYCNVATRWDGYRITHYGSQTTQWDANEWFNL